MEKTALITGASSGLGWELANVFAREGYHLMLVARNEEKLVALKNQLEAAYGIVAEVLPQDLAQRDAAQAVFDFTTQKGIAVDVLVNNAGFGDFGPYVSCDWQKQYDMVQVNVAVLMQLTHCYLPAMAARGEGKILNVASIAAFQPGPLMAVYYASKAFVLSFTEALSVELKGTGVSVTALCPGPTTTGFEQSANLGESGLFRHMRNATAKEVAEYGYRALLRGKVVAIPGAANRLVTLAVKHSPRRVVRESVYRIQK